MEQCGPTQQNRLEVSLTTGLQTIIDMLSNFLHKKIYKKILYLYCERVNYLLYHTSIIRLLMLI